MNNFEKPLTLKSTLEKRDTNRKKRKLKEEDLLTTQEKRLINQDKSQVVLEAPEKKRRISKKTELLKEDFHGENESSIFTGPENLPYETTEEQPNIDDLSFEHIVGKEERLPTPEDDQEAFLLNEFKTLDPDIIQETIRERVESGEYTESSLENIRFNSEPMRTKIDSDYGRYRSLNGVTQEELDREHFANYEMLNINKEPLVEHRTLTERPVEKRDPKTEQSIWKNLKKWLAGKQESQPESHYAKPGKKTSNWFNEFLGDDKRKNHNSKEVTDFIEKQHKLASIEDDFYSEQEHPFEEKFEKEIKEEAIIEHAAEAQKESLKHDQEAYDAKIAAEWAPFIKEKARAAEQEKFEDAETIKKHVEEITQVVTGSERDDQEVPHEYDELDAYEKKAQEITDTRDAVQVKLDNELKKAVRKTGRAPRGSLKNVHIPMEE